MDFQNNLLHMSDSFTNWAESTSELQELKFGQPEVIVDFANLIDPYLDLLGQLFDIVELGKIKELWKEVCNRSERYEYIQNVKKFLSLVMSKAPRTHIEVGTLLTVFVAMKQFKNTQIQLAIPIREFKTFINDNSQLEIKMKETIIKKIAFQIYQITPAPIDVLQIINSIGYMNKFIYIISIALISILIQSEMKTKINEQNFVLLLPSQVMNFIDSLCRDRISREATDCHRIVKIIATYKTLMSSYIIQEIVSPWHKYVAIKDKERQKLNDILEEILHTLKENSIECNNHAADFSDIIHYLEIQVLKTQLDINII